MALPHASKAYNAPDTILLRSGSGDTLVRNGAQTQCPQLRETVESLSSNAVVSSEPSRPTELLISHFDGRPAETWSVEATPVAVHYQTDTLFVIVLKHVPEVPDENDPWDGGDEPLVDPPQLRGTFRIGKVGHHDTEWITIPCPASETHIAVLSDTEFCITGNDWNIIKIAFGGGPVLASSHDLQCIGFPERRTVGNIVAANSVLLVEELGSYLVRVVDADTVAPLYTIDLDPDADFVYKINMAATNQNVVTCIEYSKRLGDYSNIVLWHMAQSNATPIRAIAHPFVCTTLAMDNTFLYLAGHTDTLTLVIDDSSH
jgi:hypothetical protein